LSDGRPQRPLDEMALDPVEQPYGAATQVTALFPAHVLAQQPHGLIRRMPRQVSQGSQAAERTRVEQVPAAGDLFTAPKPEAKREAAKHTYGERTRTPQGRLEPPARLEVSAREPIHRISRRAVRAWAIVTP